MATLFEQCVPRVRNNPCFPLRAGAKNLPGGARTGVRKDGNSKRTAQGVVRLLYLDNNLQFARSTKLAVLLQRPAGRDLLQQGLFVLIRVIRGSPYQRPAGIWLLKGQIVYCCQNY